MIEGRDKYQKHLGPHWKRHNRRDNKCIRTGAGKQKAGIKSVGGRRTSGPGKSPGGKSTLEGG